mmetsp:Transcript_19161/g.26973  ORF Transcript_19161/g.26973 Transcript_19161/m.26973 type:complete len:360 (+) Transcript_19161:919-1998(+)
MEITSYMEAIYFSLSTMTSMGYGVSDYYIGECWTPFFLVLCQMFCAITFNSIAIGLLFQRMSRGQKRGRTIIFSNKAVIRKVRGEHYFMFRVGELRRRHIIEAKVRAYCIRHDRYPLEKDELKDEGLCGNNEINIETSHFVTYPARLINPDEKYGECLLMSLPHVVVHKLDVFSPLMPPKPKWYDSIGNAHRSFLMNRGQNNNNTLEHASRVRNEIIQFLSDRDAELIILLEGTDEVTGTTVQARHSYCWNDISFDSTFATCVFPLSEYRLKRESKTICGNSVDSLPLLKDQSGNNSLCSFWRLFQRDSSANDQNYQNLQNVNGYGNASCVIDFTKFHDIIPAPLNCKWCPYVPPDTHE